MATEVKIPAMGESISSGILAAWHVKDGDYVEKNQPIYELETDKITSEANAEVSGALSIKTPEGEEVAIGQVVAEIDESASPPAASKEASAAEAASESESGPVEAPESGTVGESSAPSGPSPAPAEAEPPRPTSETGAGQGGDDAALSPAARKALEENNLQPKDVEGTGKGGRITGLHRQGQFVTA
ncbi:MAG: biotin/lipoyl-containing protein, partial [Verrucomicrobiota bacterium]